MAMNACDRGRLYAQVAEALAHVRALSARTVSSWMRFTIAAGVPPVRQSVPRVRRTRIITRDRRKRGSAATPLAAVV